jgi:hypothetical protein
MAAPPFQGSAQLLEYLTGLEARVSILEEPASPKPVYACLQANLPTAADFINCVVYVTDLKRLAHSDGTNWKRADTGANL